MKTDDSWSDIFPYTPYDTQTAGINKARDTLSDGGVFVMEGPCGSGKTLISLTAGISLLREPTSKYKRILVATSKKQQLSAFEDDLQAINNTASTEYEGLTLIGKSEVCPYVEAGEIDSDEIYYRCLQLRDNTKKLVNNTGNKHTAANNLINNAERHVTNPDEMLTIDDAPAMFPEEIQTMRGEDYCPYYAGHIANSISSDFPNTVSDVTTSEEILTESAGCGTCPHMEMRRLYPEADVLIGNYKHAFDPQTVSGLTAPILDDSTLLIADEAHEIINRVRDQLSYSLPFSRFEAAYEELREMYQWLTTDAVSTESRIATELLSNSELSAKDIDTACGVLRAVQKVLATSLLQEMEENLNHTPRSVFANRTHDPLTIDLQEPGEIDALNRWIESGYQDEWATFLAATKITGSVREIIMKRVDGEAKDGAYPVEEISSFCERWWIGSNQEYFRQMELTPTRNSKDISIDVPWAESHRATIKLHNLIPQNEIATTLNIFGGAILMSATLSPIDVYEEETGIKQLRNGEQREMGLVKKAVSEANREQQAHQEGRESIPTVESIGEIVIEDEDKKDSRAMEVEQSTFPLSFPERNRLSIAVDAPKFTYTNRCPVEESKSVRETYTIAITDTVRETPGNILVAMPSYDEAEWAAEQLHTDFSIEKEVLIDESSTDGKTETLKQEFFSGDPKVLVTSLRGTLTEGVDYDGDKLEAAVVCGVPIVTMGTQLSEARREAYNDRFDGNGYEYGFEVPAVRKTRQAIGRVIRGEEEVGIRVLIDGRYARSGRSGVQQHFPTAAREEIEVVSPTSVRESIAEFWESQ